MPREDLVEAIFFPSLKVQTAFIDLILRCDCGQNNTFHNDLSSSYTLRDRVIPPRHATALPCIRQGLCMSSLEWWALVLS